ncbi:hypothetical protein NSQ20_07815 [Paenibacillus sp. FSL K6-1122]|uniref:hypothetical protein n=1 Tax=Paenibacillus TaxID=44249 RepID=UPI0003E29A83|nr:MULTISPECIES: hypothetical protein [Paenibacillus]KAA8747025.1 hypothetical protein FE296_22775 [Paenibacillus sp. UASWS1643]ETT37983.1 hypothetical protein C161_07663 [Paenibacillus sp. FSL R5-192]ETT51622.1 hypothetical protein C170_14555 [Paenibacillus sp. FSL H7-689]MDT9721141.1 hypothetical protein [Paenibacillus sp. ClWae2A]OME97702.1 hypothetical protein BK124_17185 [Paenibacillus amylolyticus]
MGVFLDMRTSMNSATVGQPGLSLSESPTAFGTIGLQTQGVVNPIITLNGTVGVTGELGDTFVVELVRGFLYDPFYIIYRAEGTIGQNGGAEFHSFTAQDLSAPPALESVYTSFISGVSTAVRTGPEMLYGIAATG